MKVESWIFGAGVFFFTPLGLIYGFVTGWQEPVGVVAILLTAGLSLLISVYLVITSRRISPRPEDDPAGEIAEGAGELGEFAPYSWWPLAVAVAAAIIFAGLAVGVWLVLIGVPFAVLATVGWVLEPYRAERVGRAG